MPSSLTAPSGDSLRPEDFAGRPERGADSADLADQESWKKASYHVPQIATQSSPTHRLWAFSAGGKMFLPKLG
jgi:hypothetical protein